MKKCSRCGYEKESGEFYPSATLPQGLRSACKDCERGRERNLSKDRANNKKWFRKNKRKRHAYHVRRKYGITVEAVDDRLQKQKRRCGICRKKKPGGRFNVWQIDHDHKTKKFRGVLCYCCNQLLGYAKDNIQTLLNAAEYLRKGDTP